jgi:hypothetical protein
MHLVTKIVNWGCETGLNDRLFLAVVSVLVLLLLLAVPPLSARPCDLQVQIIAKQKPGIKS